MKEQDYYFRAAADEAKLATCLRAKCGSVIASEDGLVIGKGHNAPPLEDEGQRTCEAEWNLESKPKYDKTCCVHAEWNAILDACKTNAQKLGGSTLYFMRIDESGNFTDSGEPYCTVCSRLTLQAGIGYFDLWNAGGAKVYEARDYNLQSYAYHKK